MNQAVSEPNSKFQREEMTDSDIKISEVVFVGDSVDSWNSVLLLSSSV